MDVEKKPNRRLNVNVNKKSEVGDWMSTKCLKITTPEILTDIQKEKSLPVPIIVQWLCRVRFSGEYHVIHFLGGI